MKRKSFILFAFICITIFIQCSHNQLYTDRSSTLNGEYACIDNDSIYSEIYINDSIIVFQSEFIGVYGPFKYDFNNDNQLSFNNILYKVSFIDCNHMSFNDLNGSRFLLEKIDTSGFKSESLNINPFLIRNAYFRLKNGLTTSEEFIRNMEMLNEPVNIDTIIFSK